MTLTRTLSMAALAGAMAFGSVGCESGPRRIDPTSDDKLVTMGVDYDEIIEWSHKLSERMLVDGYLEHYEQPVRMVVSDIDNMTNLSNFPYEMMLGRIRTSLRNSGKVRYISTYGRDGVDTMSRETRAIETDPDFSRPDWTYSGDPNNPGTLSVARLSLRTQILYLGARDGKARQNTYEVRMFVTDVANGEVVWEGFSDPISKVTEKKGFSF